MTVLSPEIPLPIDADVERRVKEIDIPPCPAILTRIVREMHEDDPHLVKIAQLVAADVGLAAAMLQTVNSPYYRLGRKASSVHQALLILGLHNVAQLVTGLLLRQAFPVSNTPAMERFWATSSGVATIAAYLAGERKLCEPNHAYTFALFRDSGMPAMLARYPIYEDILSGAAAQPDAPITDLEIARYGVTHAHVGAHMARSWYLSDEISVGILLHHNYAEWADDQAAGSVRLAALALVAEQIYEMIEGDGGCVEWPLGCHDALRVIGLTEDELAGVARTVAPLLRQG